MNKPTPQAAVNYVDAGGKIKPATIVTVHSDTAVTLDHSKDGDGTHTAIAEYSEDKKKTNTWHFAEAAEGKAEGAKKAGAEK